MSLYTRTFWKDTAERAVKTVAQTAVSTLSVNATGVLDVDWKAIVSIVLLAGVLSILTSVASSGGGEGASLVVTAVDRSDPPGKHAAPDA